MRGSRFGMGSGVIELGWLHGCDSLILALTMSVVPVRDNRIFFRQLKQHASMIGLSCFSSIMPSESTPDNSNDSSVSISHDQKFKELIATFFIEFLELFLPELASAIEPDSVTFREQEYFVDLVDGETRIIDMLAEVKLAGEDATVHIEPQSTSRSVFPQRMFFYFSRLHQKHLKRIYPIAIFSYDQPLETAKTQYKVEFPSLKVLEFNFTAIQLNRLNWRDFIDDQRSAGGHRPNPVAAALMAKMAIAENDRPKVKAECLRLLVTLKLDPAKTALISQFVDTYLRLNAKEEQTFQAEIDTMDIAQKEEIMQATTSWEEKGMEKATQAIALKMLQAGSALDFVANVTGLTIEQIQQLQSQADQN
jgi:predicted transposase YdaD